MKTNYYLSLNSDGLHRLSYSEWGTPNDKPFICVHGLGRNGRDFDRLANYLSQEGAWVICPDIAGCGLSDWLKNPADYCFNQYLHDLLALMARLNANHVNWLGTSIGGLLGLRLASQANSPIERLILNDIGPDITHDGLKRLQLTLAKNELRFASLDLAERYFRRTLSGFGALSNHQWRHLTKCSIKPTASGAYTLRSDPRISIPDLKPEEQPCLWTAWQKMRCPSLVVHGETSDILLNDSLINMQRAQPRLSLLEIPEVGHAPFLSSDHEMAFIQQWLNTPLSVLS